MFIFLPVQPEFILSKLKLRRWVWKELFCFELSLLVRGEIKIPLEFARMSKKWAGSPVNGQNIPYKALLVSSFTVRRAKEN